MEKCKYADAYTEVYEILQHLDKNEYNKIPSSVIDAIRDNRNTNHVFHVSDDQLLMEQSLLIESKALLINIFRDYLADSKQRQKIIELQKKDRIACELKKGIYKNDLFKNKTQKNETKVEENVALIEVKEDSFINRLFKKIKSWFKKLK